MDVILERAHPSWDLLAAHVSKHGGTLSPCDGTQWQAALNAGQDPWIVLVDRRLVVTAADFDRLPEYLNQTSSSIWLHPLKTSSAAERLVGEWCAEAVALCWNNPARYALVCVRRSALAELPLIQAEHPEPLWNWLIRVAARPQPSHSQSEVVVGDWKLSSSIPARPISRPYPNAATPAFVDPSEETVPRLTSRQPAPESDWLIQHLEQTKPRHFIPESDRVSIADAVAVKAGLLLWHDAADASHRLSQSIEGLGTNHAGDYWHAILHRREPDYGNAKYWFRQFPVHSVMRQIAPIADSALQSIADGQVWKTRLQRNGQWDPLAFVDLCEACAGNEDSPLGRATRTIQAAEMQCLMVRTYLDASGHQL